MSGNPSILKKLTHFLTIALLCISININSQNIKLKYSEKGSASLFRNNKPLLILGGELGNSSASTIELIDTLFPALKELHLNTLLIPVYWELFEPAEGSFDYMLIDKMINKARENDLNLVLLWFGSWKNSMSCYVPEWIKKNIKRFPRTLTKAGKPSEIVSPFYNEALRADITAYKALMNRIKLVDNTNQVIMIQVENEIGMLPEARDYSDASNIAFKSDVPSELMNYLNKEKKNITPYISKLWTNNGNKTKGNWEEVFGKGLATDEIFTAWFFAVYANQVAKAGKEILPLPVYVNCALNRPNVEPGKYPSGGPLPHLINIWKAGAPDIDILAPDIYHGDFKEWSKLYDFPNNPLFIPEIKLEDNNAAQVFYVLGKHQTLGFSPFSIEDLIGKKNAPLVKSYKVLEDFSDIITSKSPDSKSFGFYLNTNHKSDTINFNGYQIKISHDYTLGWSDGAKDSIWPETACMIVETGKDEFWVAGSGVVINVSFNGKENQCAGLLSVDQCTKTKTSWLQLVNGIFKK